MSNPEPVRFASDRLDSWKAIANHLGREVRTVQLWEKLEGLPVHRHFHRETGECVRLSLRSRCLATGHFTRIGSDGRAQAGHDRGAAV